MSAAEPHDDPTLREVARNARDLRRGLLIHSLGYIGKPIATVLLVFVVRWYGAAEFGIFSLCGAMLWMTVCLCLLGFDQALLWWVPRQKAEDERTQVRPVLLLVGGIALALSVAMVFSPAAFELPWRLVRGWTNADVEDPLGFVGILRVMALGLVPQALSEALEAAVTGRRRLHARVFVRENLVPLSFIGAAFVMHVCQVPNGLAWAYVVSKCIGLAGYLFVFQIVFRRSQWPQDERMLPVAELRRYAWPLWLSSMLGSFHESLDLLMLSAFVSNPAVIGVYVVVIRVANVVREFRGAIAQLVVAITSKASANNNRREMTAGYSYAITLMTVLHLPVVAFIAVYGDLLLALFGPTFLSGVSTLMVFCMTRMVTNVFGNADLLLRGAGYSRLTLVNTLLAIGLQAAVLCLLVPGYGMLGAACGVFVATAFISVIQQLELRVALGNWHCTPAILQPLAVGGAIGLAMVAAWLPTAEHSVLAARAAATVVFIALYVLSLQYWWRTGLLQGSSPLYAERDEQPPVGPPHSRPKQLVAE